ncbi:hypothetical protein [Streptomyces sp. NPDC002133]|uniref:HoxN/HupN/NixA family nickel/cobalt transporter n=1 Tax=Streptomyces sp. NPDC002133 TaxID=3154409 RepID=UPI003331519F
MAAFITALHVVGWFTLVAIVAPEHHSLGTKSFGIGIGVTACTLGMRHAFDADHVAAIDNTTRKLMEEGRRPLSVGFWFSLGGASLGTAVLATVAASRTASLLTDHKSQVDALTSGFRLAYALSAAFVVVLLLVAAFALRTPRSADPEGAERAPSDATAALG